MRTGDIVMANDLLGVVNEEPKNGRVKLKDKTGRVYTVESSSCTLLVGGPELALLMYNKAEKLVKNETD